jgi:hypothetical protein
VVDLGDSAVEVGLIRGDRELGTDAQDLVVEVKLE